MRLISDFFGVKTKKQEHQINVMHIQSMHNIC